MWFVQVALFACLVVGAFAQATTESPTLSPKAFCDSRNATCETCVGARQQSSNPQLDTLCFYCAATKECKHFTENTVFPIGGLPCPNLEYNVGTCAITALIIAVLIALALILVVVMISCVCCCCCIWCAQRRKRARMVEEDRYMGEKEGIRQRAADRREERKAKTDEIRRKYGLDTDDSKDGHYKRLGS